MNPKFFVLPLVRRGAGWAAKETAMKAQDIMTTKVITVRPDTRVGEVAKLLYERHISAVPVTEKGKLVGIVSEADLLRRHEIGTDCALRGEPWWLAIFRRDSSAGAYVRTHAVRVRDIMTREVVTANRETSLAGIADLLEKHRVKRVPVVDAGRVCGILSRSDLIRALSAAAPAAVRGTAPNDEEIREALLAELGRQPWWRADLSSVGVERGVVTYRGLMGSLDERDAARVAAEGIRGVRGVHDERSRFEDMPQAWV
jgi:CBS domain-containing protein